MWHAVSLAFCHLSRAAATETTAVSIAEKAVCYLEPRASLQTAVKEIACMADITGQSSTPTSTSMKGCALLCASRQTGTIFAYEMSLKPDSRLCFCEWSPPARRSIGNAADV